MVYQDTNRVYEGFLKRICTKGWRVTGSAEHGCKAILVLSRHRPPPSGECQKLFGRYRYIRGAYMV